ncbi:MAG TPA: hypothetical protein VFA28_01795 [Bryobacteraceae bacterium]|nr:hypothetical protein [Bryobacteraceae bacterium]
MLFYSDLGLQKRLNEIVIAGSHDAAITAGKSNVKTQDLNVLQQAVAGVRFFDLRIAADEVLPGRDNPLAPKMAELKAFHADKAFQFQKEKMRLVDGVFQNVTITKLTAGSFGLALAKILEQARDFVTTFNQEFLILKFDKCTNWGLIAERCVNTLGNAIYRNGGNLNNAQIRDLCGKVIVLFSSSGSREAERHGYTPQNGILRWKNLCADGAAYEPNFDGLQYYGKGGTNPFLAFDKIEQNIQKQRRILSRANVQNNFSEVIRMMYWTTTGLVESIKKRNEKMWRPANEARLVHLWQSGLNVEIVQNMQAACMPAAPNPQDHAAVGFQIRQAMPNIVMIDFADTNKCRTIYGLNFATALQLGNVAVQLGW